MARGQVTNVGMTNVLKVLDKHIRHAMPDDYQNDLPATVYHLRMQAEEVAGLGSGNKYFYRHFCPACGELFPEALDHLTCPTKDCKGKRYDRTGKPRVKALYYDIRDKLTLLVLHGYMKDFAEAEPPIGFGGDNRTKHLKDIFDGNVINDLLQLWPLLHVIYLAMVLRAQARVSHFLGRFNSAMGNTIKSEFFVWGRAVKNSARCPRPRTARDVAIPPEGWVCWCLPLIMVCRRTAHGDLF